MSKMSAAATPEQNVRYIAALLGVSSRKVAASIAHETINRVAHASGEQKMGIATVNGVPRVVPCESSGKIRLTIAEIRAIWHLPENAVISIT